MINIKGKYISLMISSIILTIIFTLAIVFTATGKFITSDETKVNNIIEGMDTKLKLEQDFELYL